MLNDLITFHFIFVILFFCIIVVKKVDEENDVDDKKIR